MAKEYQDGLVRLHFRRVGYAPYRHQSLNELPFDKSLEYLFVTRGIDDVT
jgi:hypothetical protein